MAYRIQEVKTVKFTIVNEDGSRVSGLRSTRAAIYSEFARLKKEGSLSEDAKLVG